MSDSTVLLVPQKNLDQAKSRLTLPRARRRQLAVAMLRAVLTSATAAGFAAVVVVLDEPDDEREVADLDVTAFHPGCQGLNASLAAADEAARTWYGPVRLAVVPADLPLVTPGLLDLSLRAAEPHARAFIADRSSTGTTLLFAGAGVALRPAYGPGSAAAHAAQGAHRIDDADLDLLRRDVDDLTDLAAANIHFRHTERWGEQREALGRQDSTRHRRGAGSRSGDRGGIR
jgi:2-phospho-L-lactate/phosphoenolpyruvate guanylyltransferase